MVDRKEAQVSDTERTPERDGFLRAQKIFEVLEGCRLDVALTALVGVLVVLAKGANVPRARVLRSLRDEWSNPTLDAKARFRKTDDVSH